jgi:hypothetical protein
MSVLAPVVKGRDESRTKGLRHEFSTAMSADLGEELLNMGADGLRADRKLIRNLLLRLAVCEQVEYFTLPCRKSDVACAGLGRGQHAGTPRDEATDSSNQLCRNEGFDDVVVRTEQEPSHTIDRLDPRTRDEKDRKVIPSLTTKLMADLVSGHPRQRHFKDEQPNIRHSARLQGFDAGLDLARLVPCLLEGNGDELTLPPVAVREYYNAATSDPYRRNPRAPLNPPV